MKNNINETMSKYTAGEITLEQANEALAKAEAGFHLKPLTDEERAEKKRLEDEESTIDVGRGDEPILPKNVDWRRRKDLAGQVVRQTTKIGVYDVTYDEDGYAEKAHHVTFGG